MEETEFGPRFGVYPNQGGDEYVQWRVVFPIDTSLGDLGGVRERRPVSERNDGGAF